MINDERSKVLWMTGSAGAITSSEHPLLGVLIRFSVFALEPRDHFTKGFEAAS